MILVAPDKYKGTLSAGEVADAIASGVERAGAGPTEICPVADGGEGTMRALLGACRGEVRTARVEDALGRPVEARFAILEGGRVGVVELAEASGLWRLDPDERDAEAATTRGTGQLIEAAVAAGVTELIIAAGGSATTDGGRGALEALGARFGGGVELHSPGRLLGRVRLIVACDVENPLLGPRGAAAVFGPQKGADAAAVERLEDRLERWAELASTAVARNSDRIDKAGAGGGFAAGFWAFAGADLVGGADLVLDAIDFDRRARTARAVITGEGCLDGQTLEGKAVARVAARCAGIGVPLFAIVGRSALSPQVRWPEKPVEVVEAAAPGELAGAAEVERAAAALASRSLLPAGLASLRREPGTRSTAFRRYIEGTTRGGAVR